MNQSKKITEGALLTAIFIILMLVTVFVPGMSLITTFLLPVPFVVYAYKYDWQPTLIMLIVAILLSSLFATIVSLPLAVLVGIGGTMIGAAMHHRLTPYETLARGTVGFVLGLLIAFVFIQVVLQVNLINEIDGIMKESFAISKKMMQDISFLSIAEEDWKIVEDQLLLIKNLVPVGITVFSIVFSFIAQWISYKLLNRLENQKLQFPPLRTLRLPMTIVWIYFFAMIFMLMEFKPDHMMYLVTHNVFSLAGMFLVLQGISFMFYISHKKKWSKAIPIVGVVLTALLPFLLLYFIRILGIIDIGFGLRDREFTKKK